ncbi:ATP-binding cassette domain-containing protein [Paenibacillus sp. CMAA1739]|uniref:peptidase domain-containing ABC transporter n=2 Tax=Paenibacillus ottowii TaxID=2315729 RepID=UPI00272F5AF2|nr:MULTISPECIES: ATP-binding cassette domain-containing protein [Paenibacillus]MDP1510555.1 ATP-binding cassette domain-containing protein [Paenibacillus ottowii]MEC4565969.1 ATP-binding cassette domain-containing protein [Paenibacillus sp. CMAA1739]
MNKNTLIGIAKGNISFLVISFLIYMIFFLTNSISPFLTRYLIDNALSSNNSDRLVTFIIISVLALVTLCISSIFSNYLMSKATNNINKKIKLRLINKIQNYNETFFLFNKSGDINYRILNDVDSVVSFYSIVFISMPSDILILLGLGGVLLKWSMLLSVIVYGLLLLQLFIVTRIRVIVIKYYKLQKEKYQDFSGYLIEFFRSINLLKGINMQENMTRRANSKLDELEKLNVRTSVVSNIMSSTSMFINNGWVYLILWFGGQAVIDKTMTIGTLMAFLMITGMLYPRIESIVTSLIKLQDIKTSFNRVLEYYNYENEVNTELENKQLVIQDGSLQVDKISFGYSNELIIKDLSFNIQPNCITVIVGRNGVGKTTLCKLMAGFLEPGTGSILIDGQPISKFNRDELREKIIYQPQDQFLISGSILDNISCGDEKVYMDQINNAISKAKIATFIQALPNGVHTYIGEITSSVSGGQAQRIALARLIYKKPKIVILDEPTSFIDAAGRALFNDFMNDLKQHSTVIIITHDIGITNFADRFIDLDQIKVQEIG